MSDEALNRNIEEKKTAMYAAITTKGVMDTETIEISQQLDVLIVERMRRGFIGRESSF